MKNRIKAFFKKYWAFIIFNLLMLCSIYAVESVWGDVVVSQDGLTVADMCMIYGIPLFGFLNGVLMQVFASKVITRARLVLMLMFTIAVLKCLVVLGQLRREAVLSQRSWFLLAVMLVGPFLIGFLITKAVRFFAHRISVVKNAKAVRQNSVTPIYKQATTADEFVPTARRPYITFQYEQQLFDEYKDKPFTLEEELKMDYFKIREVWTSLIHTHKNGISFESVCTWACNDQIPDIACEGVFYLMLFIVLSLSSIEHNERVEFVEIELRYIHQTNKLAELKDRIDPKYYPQMEQDLQKGLEFYGII